MSEKYYVCSEEALDALVNAAYAEGMTDFTPAHNSKYFAARCAAKDACRARPFEKYQAVIEAGQALRNAIIIANVTGTPVQINAPAAVAAKAWDEATR